MQKIANLSLEKRLWGRGFELVVGVDEVGRGSFAGPVVAGACGLIIQNTKSEFSKIESIENLGINDSKKLTENKRQQLTKEIKKHFFWSVGEASPFQINKFGIVKATNIAVRKAVVKLLHQANNDQNSRKKKTKLISEEYIKSLKPYLILDAFQVKYVPIVGLKYQQVVPKGDEKCICIAASSIIAKVYRDTLMQRYAKLYPEYLWEKNKGYGSREHRDALKRYGKCKFHRDQFVKKWIKK